ncbi:MAG: hypothetical protein WD646_10770 [Actinomycetota bacterium]
MSRRCFALAASGVLLVCSIGCGGDVGGGLRAEATIKPPVRAAALRPIYGPALAELGLVLTARNGLIDRSDGGYRNSAEGTHLALYVEPVDERTTPDYVDGIVSVTKVFLPDVFERWPGLESFDVCQEPPPSVDDSSEPEPITQIEVTREQATGIDWSTVTLADLVSAAEEKPPRVSLHVSDAVARSPEFRAPSPRSSED